MRLAKVFPRRTNATPTDELAFVGGPTLWAEADAVHISVTFSWDLPVAERLAKEWSHVAPVEIGGPATGQRGEEFEPGRYLKEGYVITSRGCPNRCWFCSVPKREGGLRELPVRDGWNVLDDNLLACSDNHVREVFQMLERQERSPEFTGGLEAARLQPWHVQALREIHPKQLFFAYDGPEDRDPLYAAGEQLIKAGFTTASHVLRAYVLIGYPGDIIAGADWRLRDCMAAGFMPMAMLYRDQAGKTSGEWRRLQKEWARPAIMSSKLKGATKA
jgi:hypothetical protein